MNRHDGSMILVLTVMNLKKNTQNTSSGIPANYTSR